MKILLRILFIIFVFILSVSNYFSFTNINNSYIVKADKNEENDDEDDKESDDESDEEDDNADENEKESEDDDNDGGGKPRNVQVAPVQKSGSGGSIVSPAPITPNLNNNLPSTPRVISNQPVPAIVPNPIIATQLEVAPSLPSNEKILEIITSNEKFKGIAKEVNLVESLPGLLEGEVITTQKLFGIFEIQLPYNVTYDIKTGQIIDKTTNTLWKTLLDYISF